MESIRKKILKDPKVREEIVKLTPEFEVARQIIRLRLKSKMTQAELARRAGTSQKDISRLENGTANSRLSSLDKISKAFDGKLKIEISC